MAKSRCEPCMSCQRDCLEWGKLVERIDDDCTSWYQMLEWPSLASQAALQSVSIMKFLYDSLIYFSQLVLMCGTWNVLLMAVVELEKSEFRSPERLRLCVVHWKTNTRKMNYEPFEVRYLGTVYIVQSNGIDALLFSLSLCQCTGLMLAATISGVRASNAASFL